MVSGGHPNATANRQTADAFRSGDIATLASLIVEDLNRHRLSATAFMRWGIAYPVGEPAAVRELRT
jgi:hypothetical protein